MSPRHRLETRPKAGTRQAGLALYRRSESPLGEHFDATDGYTRAFAYRSAAALLLAAFVLAGSSCMTSESREKLDATRVSGKGFELSLPPGFRGTADAERLESLLREDFVDVDIAQLTRSLTRSPGFALFAYDPSPPYLTDTIIVEMFPTGASIDRLRDRYEHDIVQQGGTILDVAAADVGSMEGVRVTVDDPVASPPLRTLAYLLSTSYTWWILEYSAPRGRFDSLLGAFERSAQTFTLGPLGSPSSSAERSD